MWTSGWDGLLSELLCDGSTGKEEVMTVSGAEKGFGQK